ncbi:TetR/AcrR family transcriptional regulator [Tritonibacter scottomollicae]|uniref:TetR/AcrR family transcriptional regulator n=1 Tax=Tritonibacter scottomollicae TaxID=483013 RepID=UPI003AA8D34A
MIDTATKIAAGLERAFVSQGFAEPNVEALRAAADVSLRTLYKYTPSRGEMVLAALEHRHARYIKFVFDDLPQPGPAALEAVIVNIGEWMAREAERGCLFHAAVAAAPRDPRLHDLLKRHKSDVAQRAARVADLGDRENDITVIIEGLTQSWPLMQDAAVNSATSLARCLYY